LLYIPGRVFEHMGQWRQRGNSATFTWGSATPPASLSSSVAYFSTERNIACEF